MAFGAGKYDDLCTAAREQAQAAGAVLLIFAGKQGYGFSVQATAEITLGLPKILRALAATVEGDLTLTKLRQH